MAVVNDMAARNFTWKGTLTEADTVRDALKFKRDHLMKSLKGMSPEMRIPVNAEIGRLTRILDRDF